MFGTQKPLKNETPDFPAVFEQYKNLVFKSAYLMLGGREEAEDALQEVFLLVYRALGRYDPARGALTTWLHRITVNYCLSLLRRKHLDQLPSGEAEEALENTPFAGDNVRAREERAALIQAVRGLNPRLRAVVILRYYWELPYAEIAEVLACPLGTVKSRLDHATRSLRSVMTAEAAGELAVGLPNDHREVRTCSS